MEPKQNYLLVGVFVVLAVIAVFAFIAWMVGGKAEEKTLYYTYLTESVTGLGNGASVRFRGVEVGKVKDIRIDEADPSYIRISLDIASSTPVDATTVAVLKQQGITGVAYVELKSATGGGTPTVVPPHVQSSEVPVIPSERSELSQIVKSVPEILDRLSRVADQLTQLMSEDNVQSLSNTLKNIESLSAALGGNSHNIEQALGEMSKAMNNLAATARTVNGIADASRADVQRTLQESSRAMEQLATLLERTNQFSDSGYRELHALLVEMKKTAREIGGLTRELKEQPSKVIIPDQRGGVAIP